MAPSDPERIVILNEFEDEINSLDCLDRLRGMADSVSKMSSPHYCHETLCREVMVYNCHLSLLSEVISLLSNGPKGNLLY